MTIDDSVLAALHAELDRLMTENALLRQRLDQLTEQAARADARLAHSCTILERLLALTPEP